MGLDKRMQCFIEQIFPIIWSRYLIPVELTYPSEPSGLKFKELSPELIELLSKAIWVQSKIAFHHWVRYLRKYYDEMVSSPKMFVMYVAYACNTMGYNIQDHYERFITVCSLLVGFGANFHYSGNGEVLKYIPQILAVFFERVLMCQFYDRGGWKRLDKYLLRQEYLNWHDETQMECPNETQQQKLTRQLNFAKKVEAAILASACKDYDVDRISEKDVECDLVSTQITDEVMRCFSETSPKKKGSKKLKTSAPSQPFDEAAVEAKKNVVKGMMELVQRARLDALDKARQLEASPTVIDIPISGAASSVRSETEIKHSNGVKVEEPARKRQKSKKRKVSKIDDGIPGVPQFIEKTYEASVETSGVISNIVNKTSIMVIQKPEHQSVESTNKSLKAKKQKASKVKDNNLHNSPLSVEDIKIIMHSDFGSNNQSANPVLKPTEVIDSISSVTMDDNESATGYQQSSDSVSENKCLEVIENRKLRIAQSLSDNTLKDKSVIRKDNECTLNEIQSDHVRISTVPETNVSSPSRQKSTDIDAECTSQDQETKVSAIQGSSVNNSEEQSENLVCDKPRSIRVSCIVRGAKDVQADSNDKENFSASDHKHPTENNIQSQTLGTENVDAPENSVPTSNSSKAKYKTKRDAMNALIKIVDNLAPKIEMFVVLLDSLVWDLKKDS